MGAGRCGTTFLWYLFKELGMDTGDEAEWFQNHERLGLERIPKVIKGTGGLCVNLDKYVEKYRLQVGHIFLCTRAFRPMLQSQMKMKQDKGIYKGLCLEALQETLEEEIPRTFGKALLHICEMNYPFTIIKFPKSAQDVDYCYNTLHKALGERGLPLRRVFDEAWEWVRNPDLVRHG